jgi:hypothetical protein
MLSKIANRTFFDVRAIVVFDNVHKLAYIYLSTLDVGSIPTAGTIMKNSIYIDYPDTLNSYVFRPGDKTGTDVVTRLLGVKVQFVCNSYAKLSRGDIYEVPIKDPEEATMLVLKHGLILLDNDTIENYKNKIR